MPSPPRLILIACALAAALVAAPATASAATAPTGRLLVTLDARTVSAPAARFTRAASAVLALDSVRRDGAQVPQIGLLTVRPVAGRTPAVTAAALRRLPGVRFVEVERRHELRLMPNDPALTAPEGAPGTPAGTPLQWWAARVRLPEAWDIARGSGATVAVIDTGIDANHPEFAGKISETIDNDDAPGQGPATTDENGHGTHVSSLACAAGDNALGIAGSGLDCKLVLFKTDLSDGSVARSIVQAADRGVDAVNMSFGTDGQGAPVRAIVDAIDYAAAKGIVLVASASDTPTTEQGDPANLLQPTGTGADITAGRGLTVTASNFAGTRASFAGRGTQISLAAPGAFADGGGPSGILGAFPGNATELEASGGGLLFPTPGCQCRTTLNGDGRYAYLEGTSMAAPIVAGVAAMARKLNPDASAADIIRVLKETAGRPAGTGWTEELGWGVLDAAAALQATRAIDRRATSSLLTGRTTVKRARSFTVRWSGSDDGPAPLQPSGIASYEVWRSANGRPYRRLTRTSLTQTKVAVKAGSRYRFYTIAVDRAGNREAVPRRADLSMRAAARVRR